MPLTSGSRLGPYEVIAPLGAGGMGEVYRARDSRLGRDVALKVLPTAFAADPARMRRFEQEARAVGMLNHANIMAVYDIGTHDASPYLVTELLEGQTLRQRLDEGGIPQRKALDYARQIAAGLAAAHEKGITHRDLKPENLFLTRDGTVKILDFGLAKLAPEATGDGPTMEGGTLPGAVMGTVGYMSPEQVRGKPVDHRSDLFSLGLILYEMIAGRRPFQGPSAAEVMAKIASSDAPPLEVPSTLGKVIERCLEKEPEERFQSARDLGFALSQASGPSGTTTQQVPVTRPRPKYLIPAMCAAALLVAVALGVFIGRSGRALAQTQWSGVMLGGPQVSGTPRPSPDGHLVAFTGNDTDDVMQLWVMKPETGNRIMLTHNRTRGYVQSCTWSPDGSRIYFDRWLDGPKGVFSVPALGGEEQMILENAESPEALPDGSMLVVKNNAENRYQLFRFWPDSGKFQGFPAEALSGFIVGPRATPDGRRAVMVGRSTAPGADHEAHPLLIDLSTGQVRALLGNIGVNTSMAVTRDGKRALIGVSEGSLYRVVSVALDGNEPPRPLLALTLPSYSFDTGPDNSIYIEQDDRPLYLVRFSPDLSREKSPVERIATLAAAGQSTQADFFAVLPDGRAVWTEINGDHNRVMVVEPGKDSVPLVNTNEDTRGPLTAMGPGEVAFLIGSQSRPDLALASVANGRITHRIPFDKGRIGGMVGAPDGKTIYCWAEGAIWAVPVAGGSPRKVRDGDGVTVDAATQSLVVEVQQPGNNRLVRIPLSGGPEQEIPGTYQLGSTLDPDSIRNGKLVSPLAGAYWFWPPGIFDLASGKSSRIPLDYKEDFHHMSWTPDGKIMAVAAGFRASIWKFTPEGK